MSASNLSTRKGPEFALCAKPRAENEKRPAIAAPSLKGHNTTHAPRRAKRRSTPLEPENQSASPIKHAKGQYPPFNDFVQTIDDIYNQKIYMLGGVRPGDDSFSPTADFYCCNVSTMTWTNLTEKLTHRNPYNPFSVEERVLKKRPLPKISYPGCTLLRICNSSYIALCGGFDPISERPRADIIIIDLEKLSWWVLKVEGGNVPARISPTVVAIGAKIYVFGGYRQFDDDPQLYRSFSVAEYSPEREIWRWVIRSEPYPALIPPQLFFGKACSVYKGTKILLTPGRATDNEPIHFTCDNLFFYHTIRNRFQLATPDFVDGDFPRSISCYELGTPYNPSKQASSISAAVAHNDTNPISSTSSITSTNIYSESSVFICAWIPVPNTIHLAPEFWHLCLSPDEEIKCFNISKTIWELDHDFQGCIMPNSIHGRLRILGSAPTGVATEPRAASTATKGLKTTKRRRLREDSSDDAEDDTAKTWNIYFDLNLSS